MAQCIFWDLVHDDYSASRLGCTFLIGSFSNASMKLIGKNKMTDTLSLDTNPETKVFPTNVLKIRNFRLLWIGEGISLLGDQFYMIALPWLVLSLTGNALAVGAVMAIAGIPRALFMLIGGALTD